VPYRQSARLRRINPKNARGSVQGLACHSGRGTLKGTLIAITAPVAEIFKLKSVVGAKIVVIAGELDESHYAPPPSFSDFGSQ
jgi:hypothetical protein